MPTKPQSVTIELTPTQRAKLHKLTGQEHSEIRVEVAKGSGTKKPLSAKAAPRPGVIDPRDGRGGTTGMPTV